MRVPVTERRRALAEAAVRVIERDGVAATTVRAVAAEAGMSLASVHYAFASREELLREAVDVVVEGERATAERFLDGPLAVDATHATDIAGLLQGALAAYVASLREQPGREQGMLELTHHALRSDELAGVAEQQYAAYHGLMGQLLDAAADRCRVRWTTPTDVLARLLVSVTDGLTMQWLVSPDPVAVDAQLRVVADAVASRAVPA